MDDKILVDIIKDNKGLICSIINKYTRYYEFDDLYQVSVIGIIKAYNNYNKDSNVKFTTYAYKYILSEVVSFVNNSKVIKTSREYNKIYKRILEAKNILTQRLMKEPSNYELSLFLELDEALINNVMLVKDSVKSLDEAINNDGKTLTLLDSISLEDDIGVDNIFLKEILETLDEEEFEIFSG